MASWFAVHPGGPYTIAPPLRMRRRPRETAQETTREQAHYHFKSTLAGSKWKVVRGFHVLRHTFGAICVRAGIPMHVTAKWMGHTTEEMRDLYQQFTSRTSSLGWRNS